MTTQTFFDPSTLDFAKQGGLIPAIVQDASNLRVLMLGYMDRAALEQTIASGHVTFYSRSRQQLWTKGESSGHFLELRDIRSDCDNDTLLVLADPVGPTCHLGRASCFPSAPGDFLGELDVFIAQRERQRPEGSYTTQLFESGIKRMAQKVGEEGVETALAATVRDTTELTSEAADLLYHLIVLLRASGLSLQDAVAVLEKRHRRN
jgi:phosphoribosyl-ATP pyrophosphohydrolase/phosphoribosyl-AMP cyclohydrolase